LDLLYDIILLLFVGNFFADLWWDLLLSLILDMTNRLELSGLIPKLMIRQALFLTIAKVVLLLLTLLRHRSHMFTPLLE